MPSLVKRFTVDEVLSQDLIRFEVCTLKAGVEDFFDDSKDWRTRTEVMLKKSNYKRKFGFLPSWETLKEGQVFLYGQFEIIGDESEPALFRVATGKSQAKRIDNLPAFKDRVKHVYSDLLTGRK